VLKLLKCARFLALLCLLVLPVSEPIQGAVASHQPAEKTDCVVYVTRTGHRYHKAGCRYLRYSSIRMTRTEALKLGLTPCHVCGGSDCER